MNEILGLIILLLEDIREEVIRSISLGIMNNIINIHLLIIDESIFRDNVLIVGITGE